MRLAACVSRNVRVDRSKKGLYILRFSNMLEK